MNIVKWLVSMPAVLVVISSALTICFAGRDDTCDGSAFMYFFKNIQV